MTNMTTTNICASDLLLSKRFYTRLFEVKVAHESDWYIRFNAKGNPALEFAVITILFPKNTEWHPVGFT